MPGFSNVVVVGDWAPYRGQAGITEVGGMSLCFCPPRLRDLEAELRRWEPCWLLVGGVEEGVVERLLGRLIPAHPRVWVAMLGEGWDRRRCERWLRWGCDAYLSAAAPPERVLGLLLVSTGCRTLLVDADLEMVPSRPRRVEAGLSAHSGETGRPLPNSDRPGKVQKSSCPDSPRNQRPVSAGLHKTIEVSMKSALQLEVFLLGRGRPLDPARIRSGR